MRRSKYDAFSHSWHEGMIRVVCPYCDEPVMHDTEERVKKLKASRCRSHLKSCQKNPDPAACISKTEKFNIVQESFHLLLREKWFKRHMTIAFHPDKLTSPESKAIAGYLRVILDF